MAIDLDQVVRKGNGHTPLPLSRRAFQRALPHRVGSIEDHLEDLERRLDELASQLAAIAVLSEDMTLSARAALVEQVVELIRLVLGKRRSRRRTK
jgi:hypothetical protein